MADFSLDFIIRWILVKLVKFSVLFNVENVRQEGFSRGLIKKVVTHYKTSYNLKCVQKLLFLYSISFSAISLYFM